MSVKDVLNFIRTLLPTPNFAGYKRRSTDEAESPPSKSRRISNSILASPEDDWYSTTSSPSMKRRSGLLPKPEKSQWSLKDVSSIVIDDDDMSAPKKSFEFQRPSASFKQATSTPNYVSRLQNGTATDDDVIFVNSTLSPRTKRIVANQKGFDYIKPSIFRTDVDEKRNGTESVLLQNGTIKRRSFRPFLTSFQTMKSISLPEARKSIHANVLSSSIRLDEKKQYEEMLCRKDATKIPLSNYSDFKKYGSRWLFSDFPKTKKKTDFIDLTNDFKSKRRSTLDKIQKVLLEQNNIQTVKDTDSDVEIVNPPSPKSDFKIEKHNSLDVFKLPSDPTHGDWIENEIKKHDDAFQKRQQEIEKQRHSLNQFSRINDEIRDKLLEQKINACLSLKNVIVPVDEPAENAFKELTAEQNALVDNAFNRKRPPGDILVSKFNMNITRADIGTLYGLSWLNDEVINFYMNLLIERGKLKSFPAAYAMNTFFYPKICTGGQSSVRRWTRKVDIFSYDIIAVPIHLGMHWCMAMIDFRRKTITYYDSMGNPNNTCLSTILQYLKDEHSDKKKTELDVSDWRLINARDIPQQMNGSDCGMFSITFAEFLTRDAKITFTQDNMPYLRRKVVVEILEGKLFIS